MPVFTQLALDTTQPTLDAANLNWSVHKEPLFLRDGENDYRQQDTFALVRSDTREMLASVSARYQPIQNEQIVSFFDRYADECGGQITHGGHFDSKDIVLFADLNRQLNLGDDNNVNCMLMARTGHYPGAALQIIIGIIHVACTNQFSYTGDKGFFCRYHNLTFDHNAQQIAHNTLERALTFIEGYKERAQVLMSKEISDPFSETFVIHHLGNPDKTRQDQPKAVDRVLDIYHSKKYLGANDDETPTAWRLWNSITQYLDHRDSRPRSRFGRSALIGQGQLVKQTTFNALLEA